jgi:hypothetical protein
MLRERRTAKQKNKFQDIKISARKLPSGQKAFLKLPQASYGVDMVARCFIFKPKIPKIWVNFEGP